MPIYLKMPTTLEFVGGACNVTNRGADPSGVRDSLSAIQDAINNCVEVYIPAGTYLVEGTLQVPSDRIIHGTGFSSYLKSSTDAPIIELVDSGPTRPAHITLAGLRLGHTNTLGSPALQGSSYGVQVWGTDIELGDLWCEDCFNAIYFVEDEVNRSGNVRLTRVRASHSNPLANTSGYGCLVNTVYGLYMEDCVWREAWLDGIKLRKLCSLIRIRGGESSDNGQSFGGGSSGDGIDCFAGAEDVVIEGTAFEDNGGNGVVIKTVGDSVTLGTDFNPAWGWMRNITLDAITCRGNEGYGVAVEGVYDSTSSRSPKLADTDEDDRPRASDIRIVDPLCEYNALAGLFLNGFRVSVRGGSLRANDREGIIVGENSRDVTVCNTSILGCSFEGAGSYPAVTTHSGAARVSFECLRMNGKDHSDGVEIVNDASYAALTTYHRNGIELEDGAEDIYVIDCENKYVTSDPYECPVVPFGDNRVVLVHHASDQTTGNSRYYGGRGSMVYSRTYGTDGQTAWLKESDATSKSGWVGLWGRKHYAQISCSGVSASRTCTNAAQYYKITAFDTDDAAYGATADAANDRIQVGPAGKYRISADITWYSDIDEEWLFRVHADAAGIGPAVYGRADVGSAKYRTHFSFITSLALNDLLELYVQNPANAGEDIVTTDAVFGVELLEK